MVMIDGHEQENKKVIDNFKDMIVACKSVEQAENYLNQTVKYYQRNSAVINEIKRIGNEYIEKKRKEKNPTIKISPPPNAENQSEDNKEQQTPNQPSGPARAV